MKIWVGKFLNRDFHFLKGRSEEHRYADYIDGKRPYINITVEISNGK